MFKLKVLVIIFTSFALLGCNAVPVKKEFGSLNTDYTFKSYSKKSNLSIALMEPVYNENTREIINYDEKFKSTNNRFHDSSHFYIQLKYLKQADKAFKQKLSELITNKGFAYTGPHESFSEMPYRTKKNIYLAIEVEPNFYVNDLNIKTDNNHSYIERSGEYIATGDISIKLVEPLTKQVLMSKVIKVEDSEPKKYLYQKESSSIGQLGVIGLALDQANKKDSLTDNRDKAYGQAMSEIFIATMRKIDQFVSREEILDYQKEVKELKSRKVY